MSDKMMWFGTEKRAGWIPAPLSGAEATPEGRTASGVLYNGGGYVRNSFGTHKLYAWSWSDASSREAAQRMQSYYSGLFGKGLLYFQDPLTYGTNVLPLAWSAPALSVEYDAPKLFRSIDVPVESYDVGDPFTNEIPVEGATFTLDSIGVGYQGADNSLFIPVPPGYYAQVGAIYTRTGGGGIFAASASVEGEAGSAVRLTELAEDATNIVVDSISRGQLGIRLWIGKSAGGAASVSVSAITVRLFSTTNDDPYVTASGPWVSGQGNSGCRFEQPPTYIEYNAVDGGQVGFAATLREVGSWVY